MIFKFLTSRKTSKKLGNLEEAIKEREEIQEQEFDIVRKFNGKPDPDAPDSVGVAIEADKHTRC